jgi:hypothetical protein
MRQAVDLVLVVLRILVFLEHILRDCGREQVGGRKKE